jgi:hypothetical protein
MALLIDHHGARTHAREGTLFPEPVRAPRTPEPTPVRAGAPGNRTLDDLLTGSWDRLTGGVATGCPVCAGELSPRWSGGAGIVGGRCRDCASELS